MQVVSTFVFSALFLVPLVWEALRQANAFRMDGQLFLNLSFSIVYGYTGLTYFSSGNPSGNLFLATQADSVSIVCATTYMFSILGYGLARQMPLRTKFNYVDPDYRAIKWAAGVAFLVAVAALTIYVMQYGGIGNALRYAAEIRAGYGESLLVGDGTFIFFKNLIPLGIYLPIVSFALFIRRRKYSDLLIAAASCCVLVVGLILMSGRGRIVIFFMLLAICTISFASSRKRIPPVFLMVGPLIGLALDIFVTFGKKLFNSSYKDNVNYSDILVLSDYVPFKVLADYYEHRITSVVVALSYSEQHYTYFYDALSLPLFVIPQKVTGMVEPESISYLNTYLQVGAWDSMIPPGLAAYGLYSLGVFGIAIVGFVFGFLPGMLDSANFKEGCLGNPRILIRMPLLLIWIIYFFQGDPRVFATHLTPVLIFAVFYFVALRTVGKKNRNQWNPSFGQAAENRRPSGAMAVMRN